MLFLCCFSIVKTTKKQQQKQQQKHAMTMYVTDWLYNGSHGSMASTIARGGCEEVIEWSSLQSYCVSSRIKLNSYSTVVLRQCKHASGTTIIWHSSHGALNWSLTKAFYRAIHVSAREKYLREHIMQDAQSSHPSSAFYTHEHERSKVKQGFLK